MSTGSRTSVFLSYLSEERKRAKKAMSVSPLASPYPYCNIPETEFQEDVKSTLASAAERVRRWTDELWKTQSMMQKAGSNPDPLFVSAWQAQSAVSSLLQQYLEYLEKADLGDSRSGLLRLEDSAMELAATIRLLVQRHRLELCAGRSDPNVVFAVASVMREYWLLVANIARKLPTLTEKARRDSEALEQKCNSHSQQNEWVAERLREREKKSPPSS